MTIHPVAVRLLLSSSLTLPVAEPDFLSSGPSPRDTPSPPAPAKQTDRPQKHLPGNPVDAKDWPMYNGHVLGWRHNPAESALSRATVARLEEKWRFPPNEAKFEIGAVHANRRRSRTLFFGTDAHTAPPGGPRRTIPDSTRATPAP